MRVLNIDHGTGRPPVTARAVSNRVAHSPAPTISLTDVAWFDANGDGRIDPRAADDGGDATLLVPSHEVELPTYDRPANPPLDGRAANARLEKNHAANTLGAPDTSAAALARHAVDSYHRYGQVNPPTLAAPVAVPAPAPASAASAAQPTAVADAISAASGAAAPAVTGR